MQNIDIILPIATMVVSVFLIIMSLISLSQGKRIRETDNEVKKILDYMFKNSENKTLENVFNKIKRRDNEQMAFLKNVEDATYNISHLEGSERPELNFSEMLRDIATYKKAHDNLENITENFEEEKSYIERILNSKDHKWRGAIKIEDTTPLIILANKVVDQLVKTREDFKEYQKTAMEVDGRRRKKIETLDKRNHAKDQQISQMRKKYKIPVPKKNKKKVRQK